LAAFAHGSQAEEPLTCQGCHQSGNDYSIPHAPVTAADLREFQIGRSEICQRCHVAPHLTSHAGPESDNPVVCTDCHGAHDVLTAAAWEAGEGTTACVDCHMAVDVESTNPAQLTQLIQNGLFTPKMDNDYCLACHERANQFMLFKNGDRLSINISGAALAESVHGEDNSWQPLACTDCHTKARPYPHQKVSAASERAYHLEKYDRCARCHERQYERAMDSVHEVAIEAGQEEAAVCTDCHGAHDTPVPDEPRERISHTCQQCHSAAFDEYAASVHGDALLNDSNPDVPTCIECHGVHDIDDPTTALARLRSPQLCANCHADEELMGQYEISTRVFDTYVADFHGTTVTLFEHQDPNAETNKAVCYDCHGVHDIKAPDDPDAGIRANLTAVCQQCHPDASDNFAASWTSHFEPSLDKNPLIYVVNLFYQIVIPVTVAFLGFLVLTDIYRRIRIRLTR